jgi:hypothetical protein
MKSKKRKFLNELNNSNCGTHPAYSNFTPWFKTLDDMKEYNKELFQAIKSNSAQDFLEQQCIKRLKEEYEYDEDSEEKEPTKKID